MVVLLIVLAVVVGLALALAYGGGWGGYGGGAPTVVRRVVYRRPAARRVVTEHRVVEDPYVAGDPGYPVDGPVYRP